MNENTDIAEVESPPITDHGLSEAANSVVVHEDFDTEESKNIVGDYELMNDILNELEP
jgi:hypothetical protein